MTDLCCSSCLRTGGCDSRWGTGWKARCRMRSPLGSSTKSSCRASRPVTVMALIGGQSLPPERTRRNTRPLTLAELLVYSIIGFLILIFFVTHPSLAVFLLANFLSSVRRGDCGDWGGGG